MNHMIRTTIFRRYIKRLRCNGALASIAVSVMMVCTSCGNAHKASPEDMQTARDKARSLAKEVAVQTDTLRIETLLIEVRERESALRKHGYEDVADTYLETFMATLDSLRPSLAAELQQ